MWSLTEFMHTLIYSLVSYVSHSAISPRPARIWLIYLQYYCSIAQNYEASCRPLKFRSHFLFLPNSKVLNNNALFVMNIFITLSSLNRFYFNHFLKLELFLDFFNFTFIILSWYYDKMFRIIWSSSRITRKYIRWKGSLDIQNICKMCSFSACCFFPWCSYKWKVCVKWAICTNWLHSIFLFLDWVSFLALALLGHLDKKSNHDGKQSAFALLFLRRKQNRNEQNENRHNSLFDSYSFRSGRRPPATMSKVGNSESRVTVKRRR